MPTSGDRPKEGLRIRKKRATENAIETSAVDLALELGVENVTVEMICDRADISRSTFFNYYASRDYAIVGRATESLTGQDAAVVLGATANDLPRGVVNLLFASIGHQNVNAEVARKRAQLNAEQPLAQQMAAAGVLEIARSISPVVEGWLEDHPEHQKLASPSLETALAITLAYAAFAALMVHWSTGEGDREVEEQVIASVFADMRTMLS